MKNEDKFNELLGGPLENIVTSAVIDTLESNAELAHNAGFKEIVVRTTDRNCCQWCTEVAGTYEYPCDREVYRRHDNCGCTVEYITGEYKQDVWSKKKSFISKEEIQQYIEGTENKINLENIKKENVRELIKSIESRGSIEYNSVNKRTEKLSNEEVIKKLAGGDMTDGSCASLGFAYIGQKYGFDVLDFRGGESCDFFSRNRNIKKFMDIIGCKNTVVSDKIGWKAGRKALELVEEGKEYYLSTGKHAAIVRKSKGVYQYLELQSKNNNENGWQNFKPTTFSRRFGSRKSVERIGGIVFEQKATLYDIETLTDKNSLKTILGYINTMKSKQKKGAGGSVK